MITSKPVEATTNAADPGSNGQDLQQQISPLLARAGEQASAMAQRGVDAVRDRSLQVREQALRASDNTLNYIKDEPVKAVLIAAAAGAVLMALIGLLRRSN